MAHSFLLSLDEAEFKAFLREALRDILREEKRKAGEERPAILSVGEAAAFLKLQTSTLYEKTALRLIPHFKKEREPVVLPPGGTGSLAAGREGKNPERASGGSGHLYPAPEAWQLKGARAMQWI